MVEEEDHRMNVQERIAYLEENAEYEWKHGSKMRVMV